jgi:large subunit ribosomal protein L15
MRLNDLRPQRGSRKKEKRIGRGIGSGHGKTSTKGHKGGLARSGGGGKGPGFEGGQMPLIRRIPKRGFNNRFREAASIVNLQSLNRFEANSTVTPEQLKSSGLIRHSADAVKILGEGALSKPLKVHAHRFSRSAVEKIEKAGGKAERIKRASARNDAGDKAQ